MNFSTAQRVLQTIRCSDDVETIRSNNRVRVNDAANGFPPLSQEEADKMGIKINVNWGELLTLLTKATGQLLSAFLGNQFFFQVKIPLAPMEKKGDWENFITTEINRPIRESLSNFELHRNKWSSVICHGVGPMMWPKADEWESRFVALNDIRIPTDTTIDFKNLAWFAIGRDWTPGELLDEVFNNNPNNHWDKKAVADILKNYKDLNVTDSTNNYSWDREPEKLASTLKQDGGFYSSSAMPTIRLWNFYFKDESDPNNKGWFLRVVPGCTVVDADTQKFLWTDEKPVAPSWKQIIHCQFGDLNSNAPFKFHEVRGLGFLLLEPTFYDNLTICRMLQHVHDNFNIWLRSTDPSNRARAEVQEFGNLGIVKPGISIVPQAERHQVDSGLLEMAMSKLKQLQQEASSSYTQQADTGTQKEQTAFETRVKVEQVNAMMGSILRIAFRYEAEADREICRRFCLKETQDKDILKFQKRCRDYGIPTQWLDAEQWEVEPVTPLGMGNPTIAQASANQLMQHKGEYPPESQAKILHEFTLVTTGDARKAQDLAPITQQTDSDAAEEARGMFGTLMTGVEVPPPQHMIIDRIEALLPLLAGKIIKIEKRDNMARHEEAEGLMNVVAYLTACVQTISQDPQQKQRVKQYMDAIGKLTNQIKGIAQRGAQARQQEGDQENNGQQAKLQAELQSKQLLAQTEAKDKTAKTAQDMHHKEIAFRAEQRRKDAADHAEIMRGQVRTEAEVNNSKLKAVEA